MSRLASRSLVTVMATVLATGWLSAHAQPVRAAGSISLATMGSAYTQDFDTLASLGTSSIVPDGWAFAESGTNADATYAAGTGSSTTGNTYSFGTVAAPGDRAFGGLLSGSLVPTIGASFTNNTGATIAELAIVYTGEGWRLGADPASGTTPRGVDRLDFQYSVDATSLTTGTWVDANDLDFTSPLAIPTGQKDGNAAANRTALSATITGLGIANGATFWIRWADFNVPNSDDGLAVDDFSLTPRAGVDAGPSVTVTVPANGQENIAAGSNIRIDFSEPVDTTDPWFDIECTSSGSHTATVSGSGDSRTLDPDADFTDLEHCTVTVDAAGVTDTDTNDPPDFLAEDFSFTFQVGPECDDTFTPVFDIQGSGNWAAVTGTVDTEGVVVGDFEGSGAASGFYIQDPEGDGDAATSDGIFVYTGSANLVSAGDYVRVRGYARERFDQTTINGSNSNNAAVPAASILDCGTGSVAATNVELPFDSPTFPERFEGMSVRLPQTLVIAEYFNYDRFGEIVLALPIGDESRPYTPSAVEEPGTKALEDRADLNLRSRITLDDLRAGSNPTVLRHPNGAAFGIGDADDPFDGNRFRGGDHVANTTGVMAYDFDLYRILPTGAADYTAVNPRPAAPVSVGGRLTVASMNTLNFFVTADYPSSSSLDNACGPDNDLECRGWDSDQPTEFDRQRDKLLQALAGLDADVIGLNEIENSTGVEPLASIVAGLPGYAYVDTGVIGTDAIKVGLIYRSDVVTPVGGFELLDSSVDPRFIDTKSRPALAQTFEESATGERFTVVVNHLKSKGSSCEDIGDPDLGDGQGNCSQTRRAAAEALVDWLATDPTGSGDPDFLIVGDLNSYAREQTIDEIEQGADDVDGTADDWTNLIDTLIGDDAYSYVFDGQAGYLDHALSNGTLTSQVTGAAEWHINADEPDVLDYDTSFKPASQEALWEENAFRTSDHDPVLVGLELNAPPTFDFVAGGSCSTTGNGGSFLVNIADLQTSGGDLALTLADNTNPTLVPNANVVLGGASQRTIWITAANKTSGTGTLTFDLSDGVNTVSFEINVNVGTDASETLTGTAGNDLLVGAQGNDSLLGDAGADVLCGGNGNDALVGGDGPDTLDGDKGNDVLNGSAGDDVLRGGFGIDSLTGGDGADAFSGGAGVDGNTDFDPEAGDTSDGT